MNDTKIPEDGKKILGKSLSIELSEQKVPVFKEVWSGNNNYFLAGIDNRWFQDLLDLYYGSAVHGAILNNLKLKICKGYEDDELFGKLTIDYILYGTFCCELLWSIDHTKIVKVNHIDVSKVRLGKPDEQNQQLFYYYSNDFLKYSNRDVQMIQAFNPNPLFDDHQMYYYQRYCPGENIYAKPYYMAGLKWCVTDISLENYYCSLVENNFVANTLISINSFFDEEKQTQFEKTLKDNFTKSGNAGKMLVLYSEDRDHRPTIEKFNNDEDDIRYRFLTEQITGNISVAHMLPVQLLGILVPGKLGAANEIEIFENIYRETVVNTIKREIIQGLKPIYDNLLQVKTLPTIEEPTPTKMPTEISSPVQNNPVI
jgi:hypothetical protein